MNKRTTNSKKPEPTAAQTYAARQNDIDRQMDLLKMDLEKHAEGAKADPRNWGFTGRLGKGRRDLIDLVGVLSNMDPEHVEAFLNDAE